MRIVFCKTVRWVRRGTTQLLFTAWLAVCSVATAQVVEPPTLSSPPNGATNQPLTLTLMWKGTVVSGGYDVQVATNPDFANPLVNVQTSATSLVVNNLERGTMYYWRARAWYLLVVSNWSASSIFTTVPAQQPPGAPSLSSPADGASGQPTTLTLTWNSSGGANTYHLQLATSASFTSTLIDDSNIAGTSRQVGGLANGATYYWRVSATNNAGSSAWSGAWRFTTVVSQQAPPVPALTGPTDGASSQPTTLTLTWNSSGGANTYHLQLATSASYTSTLIDDSNITGTSRQVGGLTNGVTYYWRVSATNNAGSSAWSNTWRFATVDNLPTPAAPELASPQNGAGDQPTSLTLSWNGAPGATACHVQVSATASFTNILVDDSTLLTNSKQVASLDYEATYYWRVRARNTNGWGPFSSAWSFTTGSQSSASNLLLNATYDFPDYPDPSSYEARDYRLIGFPGASNAPVNTILPGNAGTDWQMYWDNGASANYLKKYDADSTFRFTVGRSLWLIKRGSWTVNMTAPPAPTNAFGESEIPLHAGWNLITNPMTTAIPWTVIQARNGILDPLYGFNGEFMISAMFEPYAGYYFFNAASRPVLRVPLTTEALGRPLQLPQQPAWEVRIVLSAERATDSLASFGVSGDALNGLDRCDYRKPRGMKGLLSVSFPRPDWDRAYADFARDIRRDGEQGWSWTFVVSSEMRRPSMMSFHSVADIPARYDVYLIDDTRRTATDLRVNSSYTFTSVLPNPTFTVVVGEAEFVRERLRNIPAVGEFALGANYPNPFNLSTLIPVSVPIASKIQVKIYNSLGQEVRTLFSDVADAGLHWLDWDGKDTNGRVVASGTYFCRLFSGSLSHSTRKLVLLK